MRLVSYRLQPDKFSSRGNRTAKTFFRGVFPLLLNPGLLSSCHEKEEEAEVEEEGDAITDEEGSIDEEQENSVDSPRTTLPHDSEDTTSTALQNQ